MSSLQAVLVEFCQKHRLPNSYVKLAEQYFLPLAEELNALHFQTPLFVGINGSQGSGKSTLADLLKVVLEQNYKKNVISISIDDFYHTKSYRDNLAKNIHPLFSTRGVPGTHDIDLLNDILIKILIEQVDCKIPQFNKAIDDRYPENEWLNAHGSIDIVILEGWCIGAKPQAESALAQPINALEEQDDPQAIWRNYANEQLAAKYQAVFEQFNLLIMLQAPSFDCVFNWREKQEAKLREKVGSENNKTMSSEEIKRFIEHYQRLTEHMLKTIPKYADIVFQLNNDHTIARRL